MISHWYACLWILQTNFTASSVLDTWLGAVSLCWADAGSTSGVTCSPIDEIYSASLYWSMMTITSIGYGDIAVRPPWGAAIPPAANRSARRAAVRRRA